MFQSNNDSEKSRLLIELVNSSLKDDLAKVLVLLSSKKQHFTQMKVYEAKKKFIVELFETDPERIIKIKHVSIKSIFNVISSVENPDLDLRSECYLKLQ